MRFKKSKAFLPEGNPSRMGSWDGTTLELLAPLSPTQNTRDRWDHYTRTGYRNLAYPVLRDQCRRLIGRREGPMWGMVTIHLIRCSNSTKIADTENVKGGAKDIIDLLQTERLVKTKSGPMVRQGVGLIEEDSPEHVLGITAEDRTKNNWGDRPGPGTHIIVKEVTMSVLDYGEMCQEHLAALKNLEFEAVLLLDSSDPFVSKMASEYYKALELLAIKRKKLVEAIEK